MKKWHGLTLALVMFGGSVLAQVSPSATHPADLGRYASSGATLAFVAAGVSALDDCLQPLEFQEARRGAIQILEIICPGTKRPRFARLTFVRVKSANGTAGFSPFRIEFLP